MTYPPLVYRWNGDAFEPASNLHKKWANASFVVGELYGLVVDEERSMKSHRHYFAMIREAWLNLSEEQMLRWPSPDALRKWALIATGYRNEHIVTCTSPDEACKVSAFLRPIDSLAVVAVEESTVIYATAKSQSSRAMSKEEFQASKDAVLNLIAQEIGTDTETLLRNTEKGC
jgi:hypothetical protein